MTATPSVTYSAALNLAGRGVPVFPIRPNSKVPMTKRGVLDATTEAHIIESWLGPLGRWPWQTNLAIATGDNSVTVLDVDGLAGTESLAKLEAEHGKLPPTRTVRTPSGGLHLYFRPVPGARNSAGRVGPGLDIRGAGGYVLCPPSEINGRRYETIRTGLAEMPAWLAELAAPPATAVTALDAGTWQTLLAGIPEGQRNDQLARLTGHLLRRYVDDTLTLELIRLVNAAHCHPPLPEEEVELIVRSIGAREHKRRRAA